MTSIIQCYELSYNMFAFINVLSKDYMLVLTLLYIMKHLNDCIYSH